MKIIKFSNYISESLDLTIDDIKDLLLPFDDLGIEYVIEDSILNTFGKFSGRYSRRIYFKTDFKTECMSGFDDMIVNDIYFAFLDEIVALRGRLESDQVGINIRKGGGTSLVFLEKREETNNDELLLKTLHNEIRNRANKSSSDFCNFLTSKISGDSVIIKSSYYFTQRKWNGLIRGLDVSKFDIDINMDNPAVFITMTLKK